MFNTCILIITIYSNSKFQGGLGSVCEVPYLMGLDIYKFLLFFFSFSFQHCVATFLDAILQSQEEIADAPIQQSLPGLCRNSVLITENELHSLVSIHKENILTSGHLLGL